MIDLEELARIPTSAISERELVRGYSRVAVPESISRPCSCGTVIVAVSGSDDSVHAAMVDHVRTTAHRQWRACLEGA